MKRNNRRRNSRIPFSIVFWSVFALVMATLFFCNRAAISKTVTKLQNTPQEQKTKALSREVQDIVEKKMKKQEEYIKDLPLQKEAEESARFEKSDTQEMSLNEDEKTETNNLITSNHDDAQRSQTLGETSKAEASEKENSLLEKGSSHQEERVALKAADNQEDQRPESAQREIELYFATVSDSGVVSREKCIRTVARTASPMQDSINALLQGPTKEEAKRGLRSFIPAETKLLSASIKEGSAHLNFSEDFQFNRYGIEGYNVQLQQIVFTACSFPSVESVQFLIEGQKRDFIASEGIWIGSPLAPSSF